MAFEPGKGKTGGRVKGVANKLTKTVKDTVLEVFNELQNDPEHDLMAFGKKYPKDFYIIASKLIPTEVNANLTTKVIKVKVPGEE
jgi:hypothetical protein